MPALNLKTETITGGKGVKETLEEARLWEKKNPQAKVQEIKIFFVVKKSQNSNLIERIASKKIIYRARIKYRDRW